MWVTVSLCVHIPCFIHIRQSSWPVVCDVRRHPGVYFMASVQTIQSSAGMSFKSKVSLKPAGLMAVSVPAFWMARLGAQVGQ